MPILFMAVCVAPMADAGLLIGKALSTGILFLKNAFGTFH